MLAATSLGLPGGCRGSFSLPGRVAPTCGPAARRPSKCPAPLDAERRRLRPPRPQALAPPSNAQAAPSTGPSSMFNMLVDGYVRDGLLSREEAERCSREQMEFLIRKRTGSPPAPDSSSPPAASQALTPDQVGSTRPAGCWGAARQTAQDAGPSCDPRVWQPPPLICTGVNQHSCSPARVAATASPSCRWSPSCPPNQPALLPTPACLPISRRACRHMCRTACSPLMRWRPAPRPKSSSWFASAPARARPTAWCLRRPAASRPPPALACNARPRPRPPPTAGASRRSRRCGRQGSGAGCVVLLWHVCCLRCNGLRHHSTARTWAHIRTCGRLISVHLNCAATVLLCLPGHTCEGCL